MIKITDQRLWIATHLLYPNSSQASDIYHITLSEVPRKNTDDYAENVFLKLESLFLKTRAVRSGQPFGSFENYSLDNWDQFYQKSLKQHLLVIIGLIIFELTIDEIAKLLRISTERVRFLINQAFKNVAQADVKNPEPQVEFKFRKVVDKKVSYFFTNENLVEYCLNILSKKDHDSVQEGLALYPQLVQLQKRYLKIIDELRGLLQMDLKPTEPFQFVSEMPRQDAVVSILVAPFLQNKKIMYSLTAASILVLIFVTVRPISFSRSPLKWGDNSIKMIEVNSQPHLVENTMTIEENGTPAINLNEMPVGATKEKPKAELPSSVSTQKPTKSLAVVSPEKMERHGGLYRASIAVSDIDTVTGRITEKIVSLGGKKAGEVELGWRKSTKVSYYHVTIPTENVDEVKNFLSKFGPLSIQFENHPRIMPNGFKRMILEVKEGD
ncbi:MAG: hypothetical protein A2622_07045 [Bdellovibrionales bacterium RIFCSPHIGHO2_01_FULL_40_29]|nr:MAG: hypothetical protein A2622_07045 [Bdellovibrionales bacterium RIFCSPHIGHO2_01_FULL_40_29]OFZ33231.1 MAG: hypothetical protein A3D17_12065 [Bdellovibrionales bacterium RIFCSPHIGHO2_02_FULL_40_15]